MVRMRPFAALRPAPELADKIASPPYDILSTEDARKIIQANPYSFLKVTKPEATLPPDVDPYDERVYRRGRENLDAFREAGWMITEDAPHFYVYRQRMGGHVQTGLVACASTLDYEQDRIKKHELTRVEKEDDRMRHIETLNAQTGPVFLTYRARREIDEAVEKVVAGDPLYRFTDEAGVEHVFWRVDDPAVASTLEAAFAAIDFLYVADGHHRSAAATRVAAKRRAADPSHTGDEEYNGFLSVVFPHDQMKIMAYNRVVRDIPFESADEFLRAVGERFRCEPAGGGEPAGTHDIRMYLDGKWYRLEPLEGIYDPSDPVASLDVDILQKNLLAPLLGIENPRKSKRIDFVGGIKGVAELERLVDGGGFRAAFSLSPVTIEQLMSIADAGKIMPPKSTWFEPKLKSGLAVHLL